MCGSVCLLKSHWMSRLIQCAQSANSTYLIEVNWVTKWICYTYRETLLHTDHLAISKCQTDHSHTVIDFEDSWSLQCIYNANLGTSYQWWYVVARFNKGHHVWLFEVKNVITGSLQSHLHVQCGAVYNLISEKQWNSSTASASSCITSCISTSRKC